MRLTDTQINEFNEKGYIVIKGFFDAATMTEVSDVLDRLQAKEPKPGEEAKYFEESTITGDNILVRIENVIGENNPELTADLINDDTVQCLTQLFGEAPVLFKE